MKTETSVIPETQAVKPQDEKISKAVSCAAPLSMETAFGCPRNFLENRFVYIVVSPRARGLSVGVNLNPDKYCNFDCVYCEVNRALPAAESYLDTEVMAGELDRTLDLVESGELRSNPYYRLLPEDLLQVRHVALSGDGEPTLCPNFIDAVQTVVHRRACRRLPFFKIVLITNATGLDRQEVQEGLSLFTRSDEVWVKIDAGSQTYMEAVNCPQVPLEKVLSNILFTARMRPVVVQSLFPAIHGKAPAPEEIEQYALRLETLKAEGAKISLVQIYSATRPTPHSEVGHLPLRTLADIAQRVRQVTGLKVEVF